MKPEELGDDPVWLEAWHWVMLEHEQTWTDGQSAEFAQWLAADPLHKVRHEEASQLWLLAGVVPPMEVDTAAQDQMGTIPLDEA